MKLLFSLLLLLIVPIGASSQTPQDEAPLKTTLCEIKAHPEKFQHKLVEFTSIASHGFEDSMVESKQCAWANPVPNPGMWMEFGGRRSTSTTYCCGFSPRPDRPDILKVDGVEVPLLEDDTFKAFDSALHSSPHPKQSVTVEATLQGRIFAKFGAKRTINEGMWGGYGHMGCCMLFVVTRVVSIGKIDARPD